MTLTRRGRLLRSAVIGGLLVGLLAYVVIARTPVGALLGFGPTPPCTVTVGEEAVEWSFEEAETATTVAGVGTRIGASVNRVAEAVHRALVALDEAEEPAAFEPATARQVYRDLPDVAEPDQESVALAEVLLGHHDSALTCIVPLDDVLADAEAEPVGAVGLTPPANTLRKAMRAVFGKQSLGGFDPDGVNEGHIEGSAHYEGRAIDIFFRPVDEANQRLGWQQALWAVAHAESLDVATVIFDRQIWTADRSVQGWRAYEHPSGRTDNPVLLHEDHVHVDVPR